jgi:hypothetical protein
MLSSLVIHDFNVADEIADDFYTIEVCIRDFHGGEVTLDWFTRYQAANCHDTPPIRCN